MIPFSIFSTSVVLVFWREMTVILRISTVNSQRVEDGSANAGGTGLLRSAGDGDTSSSHHHLIYSFPRLYVWGTASKYACAFASYSASYSYHLHAFETITGGPRRNSPRTQAPRSRAPHTPYDASARLIAATFVASQSTFRSDGTLKAAQRPLPPFARPMPSIQCLMIPAHNRK